MIEFACPECDEPLEVKTASAGRKVTCPECEARVGVPEEERPRRRRQAVPAGGYSMREEGPAETQRPRRPKKRRRSRPDEDWRSSGGRGSGISGRDVLMGCLFMLLGLTMLIGGLTSGRAGGMIGGGLVGLGLLARGGMYFMGR